MFSNSFRSDKASGAFTFFWDPAQQPSMTLSGGHAPPSVRDRPGRDVRKSGRPQQGHRNVDGSQWPGRWTIRLDNQRHVTTNQKQSFFTFLSWRCWNFAPIPRSYCTIDGIACIFFIHPDAGVAISRKLFLCLFPLILPPYPREERKNYWEMLGSNPALCPLSHSPFGL